MRVLLVESDPIQSVTCSTILEEKLGLEVDCVFTAQDALTAVEVESVYSMILLDLHLPDHPGLVVLETLRKKHRHIPVIMLTIDDDPEVWRKGKELGVISFLSKPLDFGLLTEHIALVLSKRH
ncbi:response regulator [Candidatus Parcubacteria bacterium]|nr:response regulator [Candidatus Parcubacteria bacterium]